MTVSYEEAVREAEDATDCAGAAREDDEIVAVSVGALLALLAGPPEPTEEEVLGAWFNVEPERLSGPKHRSEIASVQRVQQLYRSRRNG